MAAMTDTMDWSAPLLPAAPDPAWNADVMRAMGIVPRVHWYIADVPWLREASLRLSLGGECRAAPAHLIEIAHLLTAQENACRYCFGVAHAQMRLLGFDDAWLRRVEQDTQLAGVDEAERAMMRFCRNLARSDPRPARAEREQLERLGWSPLAIVEVAHAVAMSCIANRIATFLAVPVEAEFEAMPESWFSRRVLPLLKRLLRPRPRPPPLPPAREPRELAPLVRLLQGCAGVWPLQLAIDGAFASPILTRRTKAWMFAVVARALGCDLCAGESRRMLAGEGVPGAAVERALSALAGPPLDATEAVLLPWVRETVHYRTGIIQTRTRELAQKVDRRTLIEAIGVAALANACARLGMLAQ